MKKFELRVSRCSGCCLAALMLLASPVIGQPSNDEIAGATVIESLPFSDAVNTTTATNNPADPRLSCNASGNDGRTVWYVWTPAEDVPVTFSTFGSTRTNGDWLDTVVGFFVGEPGALTEVACVDDLISDALAYDAVGGTTYYIKIGEYRSGVGGGSVTVQAFDNGGCESWWVAMNELLQMESLSTPSGYKIYYSDNGFERAEIIAEEYEPFAAVVRDSFDFEAVCPMALYSKEDWAIVRSIWPSMRPGPGNATIWGDILLEAPIDGSSLIDSYFSAFVSNAPLHEVEALQIESSAVGMTVNQAVLWDAHTYWAHEYGHVVTRHVLAGHQPETLWLTEFTGQYARYGRVALFEPERKRLFKQLACTSYGGTDQPEAPSPHDLQERCFRCNDPMTVPEYFWYEAQIQVCAYEAFDTHGFQLLKDLAQFVPWLHGGDVVTAQLDSVDTIVPGIKDCALTPVYVNNVCGVVAVPFISPWDVVAVTDSNGPVALADIESMIIEFNKNGSFSWSIYSVAPGSDTHLSGSYWVNEGVGTTTVQLTVPGVSDPIPITASYSFPTGDSLSLTVGSATAVVLGPVLGTTFTGDVQLTLARVPVGIVDELDVPVTYSLSQNYPNPFVPTTTISYALPQPSDVTLSVFDLLGRQVRDLASGTQPAGTYEVTFDATGLPSSVYFYRLQAGDYVETKRMVMVR